MILTTHALTGAVIGKNIDNVGLIIIVSIAFHFLLDNLHHGEYLNPNSKLNEFWKVAIDVILGLSIIGVTFAVSDLSYFTMRNILIGAFFSMFPDLLTFFYWKIGVKSLEKIYNLHLRTHRFPPLSKEREWTFKNATNDILVSLLSMALLLI